MPTARQKILSTSWNVQFVAFKYIGLTKQQFNKRLNDHISDENCKPVLPLSRHLRSTGHHDSFGKLKVITEWNQGEQVISSLDSYCCWSPPVVLGHTVCSIGPMYIFNTVVGRLLNEFGYHTVFKNIFDQ
jgi:hypothetical protein